MGLLPGYKYHYKNREKTSQYYGVTYLNGWFQGQVKRNNRKKYLGMFKDEIKAAESVDEYLKSIGEKAVNFPENIKYE